MILIAELINHFVNGIVNMATVKKTVKKVAKKTTKKAQFGTSVSQDSKTGKYNVVTKSNTPDGPRYYQMSHPNESTATMFNAARARANSADSIPAAKVNPIDIKKLANQKNGGKTAKAKDGKWMQKAAASIKARGTEGKCTPISKPGCTGKAKALAKTFKKIAAKRKSK